MHLIKQKLNNSRSSWMEVQNVQFCSSHEKQLVFHTSCVAASSSLECFNEMQKTQFQNFNLIIINLDVKIKNLGPADSFRIFLFWFSGGGLGTGSYPHLIRRHATLKRHFPCRSRFSNRFTHNRLFLERALIK